MNANPLEKYAENIKKTGYFLEYNVTAILQKHSWNVINNRYYVDDVTNTVREIDIIAYKVWELEKCQIYTTLVISCKKSDENVWAFLTKDNSPSDPNINMYPIHNWTNSPSLNLLFAKRNLNQTIESKINSTPLLHSIFKIESQVFAFQEMKKSSHKADNDTNIYNSVTTLIKAHAFETSNMGKRKKEECFYNFNLISVVESDLVQLHFSENGIEATQVDDIKYLNRHIVFQKDDFYRIHFISFKKFEMALELYDKLAAWNKEFYSSQIKAFFDTIFDDWEKRHLFLKKFSEKVSFRIEIFLKRNFERDEKVTISDIWKPKGEEDLVIDLVDIPEEMVERINSDSRIETETKVYLTEYYRYSGTFRYASSDLPF